MNSELKFKSFYHLSTSAFYGGKNIKRQNFLSRKNI